MSITICLNRPTACHTASFTEARLTKTTSQASKLTVPAIARIVSLFRFRFGFPIIAWGEKYCPTVSVDSESPPPEMRRSL